MSASTQQAPSIWIENQTFDLLFVMGGALLTLMVPLAVIAMPALLPVFLWSWLIFFEGSHFWASFSRTYIDRDFRKRNPGFLTWSLIFFLIPIAVVLMDQSSTHIRYMEIYGFLIFVWSLYHNARQHFGFVSIYGKKSGTSTFIQDRYKFGLYSAVIAPQIFFLLNHKFPASFPSFPKAEMMDAGLKFLLGTAPKIASVITLLYLVSTYLKSKRENSASSAVPLVYALVCLFFYSTMFYIIAPMEPFYSAATNGPQAYMMIAVMNSLFHNIQYHAIVWHYSKKRYSRPEASTAEYGVANWVGSNFSRYGLVAVFFGGVFAWIAWHLGDWPNAFGEYTQPTMSTWAYCLFFGIIGHHFYLDQKIWRPSHQTELKDYLGLKTPSNR